MVLHTARYICSLDLFFHALTFQLRLSQCWKEMSNQRMSAYGSVFFTVCTSALVPSGLIFFVYLAASRFSSLWTFYRMFRLCHAILSDTYMPWRAVFSNAFSTENSLCYGTMTIDLNLWWHCCSCADLLWSKAKHCLLLTYRLYTKSEEC